MKYLILSSLLLFVGCSDRYYVHDAVTCDKPSKELAAKREKFILTCIKNGNPKSDEEPEDWIGKCENMAVRNYRGFCTSYRYVKASKEFGASILIPCTEVKEPALKIICKAGRGWAEL